MLLSGCIVILSSCKKNQAENCPPNENPSCNFMQSRLIESFMIENDDDTSCKTMYKYDVSERLISTTTIYKYCNPCKTVETITYRGNEITMIRENFDRYNQVTYKADLVFTLDAQGRSSEIVFYTGLDTQLIIRKYFYYDAFDQTISSCSYTCDKSANYQNKTLQDSTIYQWENGNIAASKEKTDAAFHSLEYLPETDGRNLFIMGNNYLHLLYNPDVHMAFSKNLLKDDNSDFMFDANGRICRNKYHSRHAKYYYRYKCI